MNTKDYKIPMICPSCQSEQGFPSRISRKEWPYIEIFLECHACHYTWNLDAEDQPIVARPKPDRRSS
jgi:hypothetical protein